MDEVIADAHTAQVIWYEQQYGYKWSEPDVEGVLLQQLVSTEHALEMENLLHQGKFFASFSVMPGSQAALKKLVEHFEVFITTAAMEYPASCAFKYAWLSEHFPFISPLNIVFCGDKSILAADFLIDDNVRHFARFKGQGVLFSAAHNRLVDWPVRVDGWEQALLFLESHLDLTGD
ncbi:hypothetical protein JQR88_24540 (plasmid) [Pseudomonas luteola]